MKLKKIIGIICTAFLFLAAMYFGYLGINGYIEGHDTGFYFIISVMFLCAFVIIILSYLHRK